MLLDCIDEPERRPRSLLLPVTLIVRDSTAPPRA
jgi:LacI family transcriptional regulator